MKPLLPPLLQSKPIEQVLAIEDTNWTFSTALPERSAVLDRASVKGSQFAPPLMEVRGAEVIS